MKRKFVSVLCTFMLIFGMCVTGIESKASDASVIEGSYLTHETESTGSSTSSTRGMDLQIGYSKIVKIGPGKFYAGGSTIAERIVESIQIGVVVERATKEDSEWYFVDGWQREGKNADTITTSKMVTVEGGYYYRVRSIHSAGNDMCVTYTDGIFIEKP